MLEQQSVRGIRDLQLKSITGRSADESASIEDRIGCNEGQSCD